MPPGPGMTGYSKTPAQAPADQSDINIKTNTKMPAVFFFLTFKPSCILNSPHPLGWFHINHSSRPFSIFPLFPCHIYAHHRLALGPEITRAAKDAGPNRPLNVQSSLIMPQSYFRQLLNNNNNSQWFLYKPRNCLHRSTEWRRLYELIRGSSLSCPKLEYLEQCQRVCYYVYQSIAFLTVKAVR